VLKLFNHRKKNGEKLTAKGNAFTFPYLCLYDNKILRILDDKQRRKVYEAFVDDA
jgi:hypothetical protein